MKSIKEITKENFENMFNLNEILVDSVFYPASGIDGSAIKFLSDKFNSFVHVDYSLSMDVIENAVRSNFTAVGYDLIGLKHLSKEELTPKGFRPNNFSLNKHEKQRLEMSFIHERFNCINFNPFALWAVYELNPSKTGKIEGKVERFSLLHIGAEACATFEAIYLSNKINPAAIAIINPGEGYGENWTMFTDPEFRLHKNLILNRDKNSAEMPQILLTNMVRGNENPCFWPKYKFSFQLDHEFRIYDYNNIL